MADSHSAFIGEIPRNYEKYLGPLIFSEYAEDLAASMLGTILGVQIDPDLAWDERRELWKISGKIYRTRDMTQSAIGKSNGIWTTTVAAAVFVS